MEAVRYKRPRDLTEDWFDGLPLPQHADLFRLLTIPGEPNERKTLLRRVFLRAEILRAENGLPTSISGSQREAALLHGEEPVTKVAQPRDDVAGGMISSLVRFE